MPKFPVVSGKKTLEILIRHFGCVPSAQNGSHVPVTRRTPQGEFNSTIPMHKELDKGTLNAILRQLKIPKREFLKYV